MYGCSIDRIGTHRIVHVFDEFTDRTATKLVEMIRSLSTETDGRIILSLLESREVDPQSVNEAIGELGDLHARLTLAVAPWLCEPPASIRRASCFGEVFH